MDDSEQKPKHDLTPPKSSNVSLVLNGAGNGMMLGALPFLGVELYGKITKKPVPEATEMVTLFATVAGCVVGAVFGMKEAKALSKYREELRGEIADLRAEADAAKQKSEGWAAKETARPETTAEITR